MSDVANLLVLPNPYAHLDARGRPAAAFAYEGMSGRDRYVGVQIDPVRTKKLRRVVFVPVGYAPPKGAGEAHLLAAWEGIKPCEVPDTAHYRMALRHGDLLPATEAVRDLVGLPATTPVGAAALQAAKAAACARYRAGHGVPAAIEAPTTPKPTPDDEQLTEGGNTTPPPADTPPDGAKENAP